MNGRIIMAALVTIGALWSLRVALFYCESCVGSLDVLKHLEATCQKYEQVSVRFTALGPPRFVDCADVAAALGRGELFSVILVVDSSRAPSFGLLRHIKLCEFPARGEFEQASKAEACAFESDGL